MPNPLHTPAPELVPLPSGPPCSACEDQAVVHWLRRPTDDELAAIAATERDRRAEVLLLADPQQPAPVFPPLPVADGMTVTVYACAEHAIGMEGAALVHASSCTAPNDADLPGCDCTPERLAPEPAEDRAPARPLPAHWISGSA